MSKKKNLWLPIFFFLLVNFANSQSTLKGVVYGAKDSTAIFGASVYFDGTSLGVSTNEDGYFQLSVKKGTTSSLVISSLGYETLILDNYTSGSNSTLKIFLLESAEPLEEVFLEADPWSREKKLRIFYREFFGNSRAAEKCRIKNEDVLKLTYVPSKEILLAEAMEPLEIINRHLGYRINYNLKNFRVEFSTGTSGLQLVHIVYYEGLSFFQELRKKPSKKFLENRKRAYTGSSLHFLRSLTAHTLSENNFRIFRKSFEVAPYEFFRLTRENNLVKVELVENPLTVLYSEIEQSVIQAKEPFYVDPFGSYTPPVNLMFGGEMGGKRVAEMLPLDYGKN